MGRREGGLGRAQVEAREGEPGEREAVSNTAAWGGGGAVIKHFPSIFGKPGGISLSLRTLISALLACLDVPHFYKASCRKEETAEHYLTGIHQPFLPERCLLNAGLL